jgi:hypothetical protein
MDDGDDDDEWRPHRSQRVARWAMLVAVIGLLAVTLGGALSILFAR